MKYLVTLAIETPWKHLEDMEFNRDLFTHGIIEESYPNYTQEEFILEMTKRLSNAYRTRDGSFFWMDGMIDGVWFTIVPDINDPYLNATVYESKYDFDNWDSEHGWIIELYGHAQPSHEAITSQAEYALEILWIIPPKGWEAEPTTQDELHVLSELWK